VAPLTRAQEALDNNKKIILLVDRGAQVGSEAPDLPAEEAGALRRGPLNAWIRRYRDLTLPKLLKESDFPLSVGRPPGPSHPRGRPPKHTTAAAVPSPV
jgi:hypothetical protein